MCNLSLSSLSKQITRFWEQETCDNLPSQLSPEEQQCESIFTNTTVRNPQGQFIVSMPLSQNPEVLGESKQKAIKQFLLMEKRLLSNPVLSVHGRIRLNRPWRKE